MFLKNVELFGFKSFADRSRIDFQEGISALLGPNGCGKSNIVDSIKWVIGEQSTRTLRAEKMEDVIFSGTDTRKALNVAEVTLTLANDGGILPLDMPEISIKRRIYRSGESEYYINSTPAKLKEIRELFFDTGVGKSAYSIMEQGKIDQVLSNKPEDRRYIFEEAAGITKYKIKGQEAEKKLEKTEENMRQVDGILGEVKRSHDTLRVQAEKTNLYRSLRDNIFQLDTKIQLLRLRDFLEQRNEKEKQLEEKNGKKNEIKGEIDSINESLEENLDLVNSMESQLIQNQKRLYEMDLEKNNKENQILLVTERISEFQRQIESKREQAKGIEKKIASFDEQIAQKRVLFDEYGQRIKEIENNAGEFHNSLETAQKRIRLNESEISRLESENRDHERDREEHQEELRKLTDVIVAQLDTKLKESGYSYKDRKALEEEISSLINSLSIHISGRVRILEDVLRSQAGVQELQRVADSSLAVLKDSIGDVESLNSSFAKYLESIPAFIDEFLSPEGIITQKRDLELRIEQLKKAISDNRNAANSLRKENNGLAHKIEEYRKTLEELRINLARLKAQQTAVEESINLFLRESQEQKRVLEEYKREAEEANLRINDLQSRIEEIKIEKQKLEEKERSLKSNLSDLEKSISTKNKDLITKEKSLKDKMEGLSKVQVQVERLQIDLAALQTEIRNIYDNYKEKYSRDLEEFQQDIYEIQEQAKDIRNDLNSMKEEQKKLGQVNLMAVEEFNEVKERYDFLLNQLNDLKKAKEELKAITGQIKLESTELFLETYEKIRKNFHVMFRRLFGGGRAELKLSEPDNILESGIEIFVQPPGKKLENIALLSGGERSLTAVALLFATYMVKPSPFCILDEIDAALDEENVGRFVNLLMEFGKTSQFIIITHNKKTVMGANTLLGVTMEESGVSKIIAIRLDQEKKDKE